MKAYTDLQQSKKLAEILPLESADMLFQLGEDKYADSIRIPLTKEHWKQMMPDIKPCWSLAALIEALPKVYLLKPILDLEENSILYSGTDLDVRADNIIDACVEMIVKLHELEML